MSKRRKVLVILGLIVLAVVCFATLRPRNEPKYQGRYLSEWVAIYERHDLRRTSPEFAEAKTAVQTIGTNALPYFLKWMRDEPSPWRVWLSLKLPRWIADNRTFGGLIYGPLLRAEYGYIGVGILGTNALMAMPELEAMMRDDTKPACASLALYALITFGEPAIPIFQAALADPHQADRDAILYAIGLSTLAIGTNKYLPIFVAALTNDDARVRRAATNVVNRFPPEVLTNAPAP